MKKKFEIENFDFFYLVIILLTYVLLTNTFFNFEESLIYGAADGLAYFEISKNSPGFPEISLQPIHTERFFFPYFIGLISKIFPIEIYDLYRVLVVFLLISINLILINILKTTKRTKLEILFCIILFNFNPYLSRFYISNPLIINDLIFIIGSVLCLQGILKTEKRTIFFGLVIACLARQSGLAIPISLLFLKFLQGNNFFLNKKEIVFSFLLFFIIYFISFFYSEFIPKYEERSEQYFITIFGIFIEDISLKQLILLFAWSFLSFAPLVLFILLYFKFYKKNYKLNKNLLVFSISLSVLLIGQGLLQGYEVSGKNIIRLTTQSFVHLLIFFLLCSKEIKFKFEIKLFILMTVIFIWNCHPTFSIYSFLESFRY